MVPLWMRGLDRAPATKGEMVLPRLQEPGLWKQEVMVEDWGGGGKVALTYGHILRGDRCHTA